MLSIHDNVLNGYEVDGIAQTIVLHTVDPHADPPQHTDVLFDGVLDHYLRDTLLPSILYDIEPSDASKVIRESLSVIVAGHHRNGWPSFFADQIDTMVRNVEKSGCRFYVIGSSLGLDGWILAQDCRFNPRNDG